MEDIYYRLVVGVIVSVLLIIILHHYHWTDGGYILQTRSRSYCYCSPYYSSSLSLD
jgi:hypothetical protein